MDTINDDGHTPLHLAVATGQWQIARWLRVAGASPNLRNRRGDTALHIASRTGDVACCRAIAEPIQHLEKESLLLTYSVTTYQPVAFDQWNYSGKLTVFILIYLILFIHFYYYLFIHF